MKYYIALCLTFFSLILTAQSGIPIGNSDFSDWTGVSKVKKNEAIVKNKDTISYTYSNQNRVYFPGIMRDYFGDAADWTPYSGLSFEVYVKNESTTAVTALLKVDSLDYKELKPISTAKIQFSGQG
ncbi:hypothetical protein ACFFU9_11225 [Mariniflexile ostreae]|uniref:Uncharacterized protein n=1 Tax=Mariniflexile ostreae TaxID=1520892 RepID=A0ABV5FCY7_9FLAO